jgi:hypothetical protein
VAGLEQGGAQLAHWSEADGWMKGEMRGFLGRRGRIRHVNAHYRCELALGRVVQKVFDARPST